MKEKQLIGIVIVLIIIFSFFLFFKIKKRRKEKKELEEKVKNSEAYAKAVLENSQNLKKWFAQLALIPDQFLKTRGLQCEIEKKLQVKEYDLDQFIKIIDFASSLERVKKEIVFELLTKILTKSNRFFGNLISRSIIKSEIEVQNFLFKIFKDLDPAVRWRVSQSADGYMKNYFRREKCLSESRKDKLNSETEKVKRLVYN